jgi:hypothetical protein
MQCMVTCARWGGDWGSRLRGRVRAWPTGGGRAPLARPQTAAHLGSQRPARRGGPPAVGTTWSCCPSRPGPVQGCWTRAGHARSARRGAVQLGDEVPSTPCIATAMRGSAPSRQWFRSESGALGPAPVSAPARGVGGGCRPPGVPCAIPVGQLGSRERPGPRPNTRPNLDARSRGRPAGAADSDRSGPSTTCQPGPVSRERAVPGPADRDGPSMTRTPPCQLGTALSAGPILARLTGTGQAAGQV